MNKIFISNCIQLIIFISMFIFFSGCEGEKFDQELHGPLLTDFKFIAQDDADPYTLFFSVHFEDTTELNDQIGDLGDGYIYPIINGQKSEKSELMPIFKSNQLKGNEPIGDLYIALSVSDNIGNNTTFKVGLQVVDKMNHSSNVPTVKLKASRN